MCPLSDSRQIYKNQFDKKEKDGKKKGNLAKKSQLYTNFIPFFPFSYNKMTFILLKRESKYSESKREMKTNKYRNGQTGQCKNLRGKFINCYLCLQIHSLWN